MRIELTSVPLAIILFGIIVHQFWMVGRSRSVLAVWAWQNSYEITFSQLRWFFKGPFFLLSLGGLVYRVVVRDERGQERQGWVRCCSPLSAALFGDTVDVRWDDER